MSRRLQIRAVTWACDCGAGRDADVHLSGCAMSASAASAAFDATPFIFAERQLERADSATDAE